MPGLEFIDIRKSFGAVRALRGVSLTVAAVHDDGLSVAVIPHTAEVTTLGRRAPGDAVNLEVDVTAKHVERLLSWYRSNP